MGIKSDKWIIKMCEENEMITPFERKLVSGGKVSFGVSSYGYDIRIGNEFKVFTKTDTGLVDPKNFDEKCFAHYKSDDYVIIPANSFILAATVERFKIPRNVLGIALGKSTYARCGIVCHITPLEPEWEGTLVLELSNTTPLPAKVYANEGIAQLIFIEGDDVCDVSYADRKGKYQNQKGIVTPRIKHV